MTKITSRIPSPVDLVRAVVELLELLLHPGVELLGVPRPRLGVLRLVTAAHGGSSRMASARMMWLLNYR